MAGPSDKEKELIQKLVEFRNLVDKLPRQHPMEYDEFTRVIHRLTDMIYARAGYRDSQPNYKSWDAYAKELAQEEGANR